VAEEFRLEDALGESPGVDGDERLRGARAQGVERARDDLLARAVLARDEDVGVRRADVFDQFEDGLHRLRPGDEERAAVPVLLPEHLVLGFEPLALAQGPGQLRLRPQDGQEPLVLPGLLHEVARAPADGLDGEIDAPPRRHHDHGERGVHRPYPREEVQALLPRSRVARVVQIDERHVEALPPQRFEHVAGRGDRLNLEALGLEEKAQGLDHGRLVICNQDTWHS
jgi:hypothetical protein